MRATVLLNAAAGVRTLEIAEETERIVAGLELRGVAASVRPVPGPELTDAAREAAAGGAEAVVMAGGDGTVSAGAAALVGGDCPMGVLPLGTLNHFARDLGIPQDMEGALEVVATGLVRRLDVGEANGRIFLNNASMGLYPQAVIDREQRQDEGASKWPAMMRASLATLRRFPVIRVTLRLPTGAVRVTTPFVFVGNNRYEMKLLSLGKRSVLDGGELWVYAASHRGRIGFLSLALRAVVGRLDQGRDFLGLGVPEVTVEDRRRTIPIAFDGEVCEVESPLVCRIRPAVLPVIAPAQGGAALHPPDSPARSAGADPASRASARR